MVRPKQLAVPAAAALLLATSGCGGNGDGRTQPAQTPTTAAPTVPDTNGATPPGRPTPPVSEQQKELFRLLVPRGVPQQADGQPANKAELVVVKRWLAALTLGDIGAAADTFADGAVVQNLQPPAILRDRAARLAFNDGFPCGAEVVTASSVKGYLVLTYRLTDRKTSACDGPGGTAAGAIKVEDGKMTEWYRLPDPESTDDGAGAAPVV